jgi:hypothetical protein
MALPHIIRSHPQEVRPTMTALVMRKYLGRLTEEQLLDGQVVRSHSKKGEERGEEAGVLKKNPLGVTDHRKVEVPHNLKKDPAPMPKTKPLFGMTKVATFSDPAARQQGIHEDHRPCPMPNMMKLSAPAVKHRSLTYGMVSIKSM